MFNWKDPESFIRRAWWHFCHYLCFAWFRFCYRHRAYGIDNLPRSGPVLLVANHQSFLDPIVVGLAIHERPFHAMARITLFKNPFFGWLLRSFNSIPVDQDHGDLGAMRQAIDVLKKGRVLMIYPEGARSENGVTGPFASGIMLLIKRAKPMVVPAAVDGAFDAWPRDRALPRLSGRLSAAYGKPIPADELLAMKSDDALALLRDRVEAMRLDLAQRRLGRG